MQLKETYFSAFLSTLIQKTKGKFLFQIRVLCYHILKVIHDTYIQAWAPYIQHDSTWADGSKTFTSEAAQH